MGALHSASLSALLAALVASGCAAVKITSTPVIAGRAKFPESGGVTSGLELSTSSKTKIHYVDFVATDSSGKAVVEFRWKPHMKSPYYQSVKSDVAGGEEWVMKAFVLFEDSVLRSRYVACKLTIVKDGALKECKMTH